MPALSLPPKPTGRRLQQCMRYVLLMMVLVLCKATVAQQMTKQTDTLLNTYPMLPVNKVYLLSHMDLIANMQVGMNNYFANGQYTGSRFSVNQFRLEIKGQITPHVYFRFRDRYTRQGVAQSGDNVIRSTDLAFIDVEATKRFDVAFGKLCADWGGYEFDANPIYMYDYNDIVKNGDNFLSGAQVSWKWRPTQRFTLQVLNARTRSFKEIYDTIPGVKEAQFPSLLVGNWRGAFFDQKVQTLWSYGYFTEAKKEHVYYIALGNRYDVGRWQLKYDFKFSREDLDRTSVVTQLIPKSMYPYAANKVQYVEHWLQVDYRIQRRWHGAVTAFVDDAYWKGNPDPQRTDHLRTGWGIIPTIEFYPFDKFNLKFFCSYTARLYRYTPYAKQVLGQQNNNTGLLMIGIITPLVVL